MELLLVLRVMCSVAPRSPIRFNEIELKGYESKMLLN